MANPANDASLIFPGPSETAQLARALDWSRTPLGPTAAWPAALRHAMSLILTVPFPMVILWGEDRVQLYNDGYSVVMGDKHPAGLGVRTQECWPEAWDFNRSITQRVMESGESIRFEEQRFVLERYGYEEETYFSLGYSPIYLDDGTVGGVLATVVETTQAVRTRDLEADRERLQEALESQQARLLSAFRLAPTFVAVLRGPDHVFEYANEMYLRVVGKDEVVGKSLEEALPELRGGGFDRLLDEVKRTGVPYEAHEMPIPLQRVPDAPLEVRYIDFVYQAIPEADGSRDAVVVHGSDVTEHVLARRALEEVNRQLQSTGAELARRTEEAETANRAKSEFLAVMSHELRTPLSAIGGYADLLDMGIRGPVTPEQSSDLARIQQSQRHLLGLINEVLNFAKLETGRVDFDIRPVATRGVVAAAHALLTPQAHRKELALILHPCPDDLYVLADEDKLRQILVNLLSNAVKFTPERGWVHLRCTTDEGHVYFEVEDTGIGIPEDKLASVFEPFVQVRSDLTRTQEGTGLGLAISRELARGMGGDLIATSQLGRGSCFMLNLPLTTDSDA